MATTLMPVEVEKKCKCFYGGCALSYQASLQAPQVHHSNKLKQMIQIKHNRLKSQLTGGRSVGFLQSVVWLSSGLPKTNPASGREEDLNQGPPNYKSSALTTRPRRLPIETLFVVSLASVLALTYCVCFSHFQLQTRHLLMFVLNRQSHTALLCDGTRFLSIY